MGLLGSVVHLRHQRKLVRLANRFDIEAYIELRPIQVVRTRTLHVGELLDRRLLKPRKIGKRQKYLFVAEEDPETVFGDVRHFSFQSAWSRHHVSPASALQRLLEP